MTEVRALKLQAVFGGEVWHSGGGIWLLLLETAEGRVVVFSDELVTEHESMEDFIEQTGEALTSITLV